MGRYDPTYAPEEREAIIHAVLDEGLSARQAVERAAAGELGIPAFEMPVSTAQDIVGDAKRNVTVGEYRDRLEALAARGLAVVEGEMDAVERTHADGRGRADQARLKRAVQGAQHLARLIDLLEPGSRPCPRPAHPPPPQPPRLRVGSSSGSGARAKRTTRTPMRRPSSSSG